MVFCKEGFTLLADRWTSPSDLEKLESTDSDGEGPQLGSDYHCQGSRRILYLASQHLQGVSIDTPALSGGSPTANDIKDSAQQLITPQLYNFLAWITGSAVLLSLTMWWKLVIPSGGSYYLLLKTLYIYIYISTKGRKTMPKRGPTEGSCSIAVPAMSNRPRTSALRMLSTHSATRNANHM